MHWADGFGLSKIAEIVARMHAEQGALVRRSALLKQLARDGRSFGDVQEPQPC